MYRRLLPRLGAVVTVATIISAAFVVIPTTGPTDTAIPAPTVSRTPLADGTTVDDGWSTTVKGDTNLVGLHWNGDDDVEFAVDRRTEGGRWKSVGTTGQTDVLPDPGSPDARSAEAQNGTSAHASEPVWVGNTDEVRIRLLSGTARGVRLDRVRAPQPSTPPASAGASVPAQPGIVSRAGWGADESLRLERCPSGPDYDARVQMAIVHHTVNSNDYSPAQGAQLVRSIYGYHTVSQGYCDIAYDFLIDRYGTVYEGRYGGIAEPVHGAHSIGYNTNTTGIALIGDYSTGSPTGPQLGALNALVAWKLAIHNVNAAGSTVYTTTGNSVYPPGTTRVMPTVVGHRDTWSTGCPGQNMYPLLPAVGAAAAAIQAAAPRPGWRGWDSLGGVSTTAPAAASWQPNRIDTFVRGTDNQLWHKWWDNAWYGWERLGGNLGSAPTAVAWGPSRLDVFATAPDHSLRHTWFDGARWLPWENLGGNLSAAPAVASWTNGRLDVFGRGAGGQVVHRYFDGNWSAWESLGGSIIGAPAAVSWVSGRIDLFVRGTDNGLFHRYYQNGWSPWEALGGVLTAAPAVSSWAEGRLDVFVRGADNQTWHKWYDNGWYAWEGLGGALRSAPAAVSWQPERIDIFVRGTDNRQWHRWFG